MEGREWQLVKVKFIRLELLVLVLVLRAWPPKETYSYYLVKSSHINRTTPQPYNPTRLIPRETEAPLKEAQSWLLWTQHYTLAFSGISCLMGFKDII